MECDIVTNDDDDDVDGWMRSCVLPACGFRLFWLDWGCTSVTRWADGGLSAGNNGKFIGRNRGARCDGDGEG